MISPGAVTPADVDALLRTLPDWFGIAEENRRYAEAAAHLSNHAALVDDRVIGVALTRRHTAHAAELVLLAVHPDWHRRGVGRRLVSAAERDVAHGGLRLLQVKTLGPSDPSPEYAATRAFYTSLGYLELEETDDLWPGQPCLILVKVLHPEGGGSPWPP